MNAHPAKTRRSGDYSLRPLWKSADVVSLANGTLLVTPQWKDGAGGGLSRIASQMRLLALIERHLKRK